MVGVRIMVRMAGLVSEEAVSIFDISCLVGVFVLFYRIPVFAWSNPTVLGDHGWALGLLMSQR